MKERMSRWHTAIFGGQFFLWLCVILLNYTVLHNVFVAQSSIVPISVESVPMMAADEVDLINTEIITETTPTLLERIVLHMFGLESVEELLIVGMDVDTATSAMSTIDLRGFVLQSGDADVLLEEVAKFSMLQSLTISGLGLTSLEPLASLQNAELLEVLVADGNAISDLSPLANFTNLKSIDLTGNPIVSSATNLAIITAWQNKIPAMEYKVDHVHPTLSELSTTASDLLINDLVVQYKQVYSNSSNFITLSLTPLNATGIQVKNIDPTVADPIHVDHTIVFDSFDINKIDVVYEVNKSVVFDENQDRLIDPLTITVYLHEGVNVLSIQLLNGYFDGVVLLENNYSVVIDYIKLAEEEKIEEPTINDPYGEGEIPPETNNAVDNPITNNQPDQGKNDPVDTPIENNYPNQETNVLVDNPILNNEVIKVETTNPTNDPTMNHIHNNEAEQDTTNFPDEVSELDADKVVDEVIKTPVDVIYEADEINDVVADPVNDDIVEVPIPNTADRSIVGHTAQLFVLSVLIVLLLRKKM